MVSHWSLSDSKSPQVYRTLLGILANLSNAVVYMVFTCPLISNSSSPFINPLVIVPSMSVTIGITITFMFHSFFSSPARSQYLFFFSLSFSFNLSKFSSFCWLFLGPIVWPSWDVSQNPGGVCASDFPGWILGCVYTICLYIQISISCTILSGSPCLTSRV